jgi:hypothetical protein
MILAERRRYEMDVAFIQIGLTGIALAQIIDIQFGEKSVYITTTERDGDRNMVIQFTDDTAVAIKDWWENAVDVYRIV